MAHLANPRHSKSNDEPRHKRDKKLSLDNSSKKKRGAAEDAVLSISKKRKASKLAPIGTPIDTLKAKVSENANSVPDTTALEDGSAKKAKSTKDATVSPKDTDIISISKEKRMKSKGKEIPQVETPETPSVDQGEAVDVDEFISDEEIDEQTEAILGGLESDDENSSEDESYEASRGVPKINTALKKKAKAIGKAASSDKPGVLYVGRIPHGFYEREMKQYFSQFGDVRRLRLSRNRKTGRSKHFAFLEFKSAEVAEIVAKTMDNYLLFGHILKCKIVPSEQVHADLFKGANKPFKKIPWNKLEGLKLAHGTTTEVWDKRVEKEERRRSRKSKALEQMGYSFKAPKLKVAGDILHKDDESLI